MATRGRNRSAGGPGVLLVAATGLAAAAVALDAGFDLPAGLRAVLFAAWAAAVGVLGWGAVGRSARRRGEAWLAGGATVAAFGLVVVCVPGGVRASRLVPPWSAPPAAVRLTVTTGNPVVARGAGVTLACVCERLSSDETTPVRLEVRGTAGHYRSVEPTEEVTGVLSARLPAVFSPLAYRFVGGGAATAWHRITPTDPVALTANSSLTAHPPAYAVGQFPTRPFAVSEPVTCLAGGRVSADLSFDRPATDVRVVWTPDRDQDERPVAVALASDGRSATFAADVTASGRITLILTGDHGYRTVVVLPVTAVPDRPPEFITVGGFDAGRWTVRADEALTLSVEVQDDAWAAAPVLKLLVGATPETATTFAITLNPLGGGRYAGRLNVPLADRWRGGRAVARLRLADPLRPAGVTFPPDGWAEFIRGESAAPLGEQIVVAQRDRVSIRLAAAQNGAGREQHLTAALTAVRHVEQLDPLAAELQSLTSTPTRLDGSGWSASLTAAQELNRRLAVTRLDRLRLLDLADTARRLADRNPSTGDIARIRDRLAAVTASSPRLTAARAAADERSLADAVATANRLANELDTAADRVLAERAARLSRFAGSLGELAVRTAAAEAWWSMAARLTGSERPAAARLRQASLLLRDARPADALPVLDAAGRQLADLATAFAQAADARGDPREAARQLLRWRADLDARPGPPPADELNRWHACARELTVVAHRYDPTGGDTPDRIARDFPSPEELKRRAARTLREIAARSVADRQPTELAAFAAQLDALPPPAEGRHSRLASAVAKRTAAELAAGRTHDVAAGAAELRWRAELLAQKLAGDGDPLAVLDAPATARAGDRLGSLAVRVGLPPDLGDDATARRAAVRERIDGTDTERQRVSHIAQWWASRAAIGPEHVRDLLAVLETVRVGDTPEPMDAVVRLLRDTSRPAGFKGAVSSALIRLKDGLGRHADTGLFCRADLDKPTAAGRLMDLDTGGRLPSRALADVARRLAGEVQGQAREVATVSAELHAAPTGTTARAAVAAEFARLGTAFRRHNSPGPLADRWGFVLRVWDEPGDVLDGMRATAAALRQLECVARHIPAREWAELGIGQQLAAAEAALTGVGEEAGGGTDQTLRRAASAFESAAK